MFERLCVQSLVPYAGWTFFTLICCKICIVCLKRPKINKKETRLVHFLKKRVCWKQLFPLNILIPGSLGNLDDLCIPFLVGDVYRYLQSKNGHNIGLKRDPSIHICYVTGLPGLYCVPLTMASSFRISRSSILNFLNDISSISKEKKDLVVINPH